MILRFWPYQAEADGGDGGGSGDAGANGAEGDDDAGDAGDGEEDAGEAEDDDDAAADDAQDEADDAKPKPKPKSLDDRLERLRVLEQKMEQRELAAVEAARFAWLKRAGIKLPKDLALKLAPAVDPGTDEGERDLIAFAKRTDTRDLFDSRVDPKSAQRSVEATIRSIEERQKGKRHKNRLLSEPRVRAMFSEREE